MRNALVLRCSAKMGIHDICQIRGTCEIRRTCEIKVTCESKEVMGTGLTKCSLRITWTRCLNVLFLYRVRAGYYTTCSGLLLRLLRTCGFERSSLLAHDDPVPAVKLFASVGSVTPSTAHGLASKTRRQSSHCLLPQAFLRGAAGLGRRLSREYQAKLQRVEGLHLSNHDPWWFMSVVELMNTPVRRHAAGVFDVEPYKKPHLCHYGCRVLHEANRTQHGAISTAAYLASRGIMYSMRLRFRLSSRHWAST